MNGRRTQQRTFLVLSDYITSGMIGRALPSWKQIQITSRPHKVDFIYTDGSGLYSGKLYRISATLKPRLDSKNVLDKAILHSTLTEKAPHTIQASIRVTSETVMPPNSLWILRANTGSSGTANWVASNQEELTDALVRVSDPSARKVDKDTRELRVIASDYIRDPMLYNGRKFHLRVMYIVLVGKTTRTAWIMKDMIVIPAREKYIDTDFNNKLVHDTHFADNPFTTLLSELPNSEQLVSKVADLMREVNKCIIGSIKKYDECTNGYDNYGVDVMFTADGTAKLIEINRCPSLDFKGVGEGRLDCFNNLVLDALMSTVHSKVFDTKKRSERVIEL